MSKADDAWHNRPMVVTVLTHCEHCNSLKKDVEPRFWSNYYYGNSKKTVDITSCKDCFDKQVEAEKSRKNGGELELFYNLEGLYHDY